MLTTHAPAVQNTHAPAVLTTAVTAVQTTHGSMVQTTHAPGVLTTASLRSGPRVLLRNPFFLAALFTCLEARTGKKSWDSYLHHVPGSVAYADHDDGQRELTGMHDRFASRPLVRHLTVGDDHQNVVLKCDGL